MLRRSIPFLALMALGACAASSAGTYKGNATLTKEEAATMPGVIGGNDDLRIGAAPPASPSDIKISAGRPAAASSINDVRRKALTEGAQTYGAQMGYARRSWEIMNRIQQRSGVLSQVFDFNKVVARAPVGTGVIIPPVVSTATRAFTVDAYGQEAASADAYMTITRAGRIAAIPPTWRDYLVITAPVPSEPAKSLLPATNDEKTVFEGEFQQGWQAGVKQAEDEFAERIARLQRDFHGMLQYHQLVRNGMIDKMVLANADFGVTANEREMRIGSKAVKITSEAEFNADPKTWSVRSLSQQNILVQNMGGAPGLGDMLN